jgi:hypothetical protein
MPTTAAMTDVVVRDGSTVCLRQAEEPDVAGLVRVAPEIQELDVNPVIVLRAGARVADVRLRVDSATPVKRGRRVEY